MNTTKFAKAAVALVGLAITLGLVMNWVGDYREASKDATTGAKQVETTPTASAEEEPVKEPDQQPAEEPAEQVDTATVLVVTVDGLNFRTEPTAKSKAIRGLSEGEKVVLLATEGDWLKVRDNKKVVGYITSDSAYTDPAE